MKAVRFNQFRGPGGPRDRGPPRSASGPSQVRIAVRVARVNPSAWKKRKGLMDRELPQTMGHEAAGVVDELGEGRHVEHATASKDRPMTVEQLQEKIWLVTAPVLGPAKAATFAELALHAGKDLLISDLAIAARGTL
jgi:hypothetical protein